MSKKKASFLWVRDDQEEVDLESEETDDSPGGRIDRSEHRSFVADLKDLANRLSKLPAGQRKLLPLDEEGLRQVELLANAHPGPERRRALMHMKAILAASDLEKVEKFMAGETPAAIRHRDALHWRNRLLEGDDQTIQTFIGLFPGADRQAIRSQVRETRKTNTPTTQARLLSLIHKQLGQTSENEPIAEDDTSNP